MFTLNSFDSYLDLNILFTAIQCHFAADILKFISLCVLLLEFDIQSYQLAQIDIELYRYYVGCYPSEHDQTLCFVFVNFHIYSLAGFNELKCNRD